MTWRNWDGQWSKSRRSPNQSRKEGRDNSGQKDKRDAGKKFPAYDASAGGGNGAASSGSSASAALASPQVVSLLKSLAESDQNIAAKVEGLLPNPIKEDIREKQRVINTVRKLQQKVERKEQAISRKETQMQQFLVDVKEHIVQEKIRHKAEIEQLTKELDEAKDSLEKAKNGQPLTEAEPNEDLEMLLAGDEDMAEISKENLELKQRLATMEQEKDKQAEQMYNMQSQMENFMKQYADQIRLAQAAASPAPSGNVNPLEVARHIGKDLNKMEESTAVYASPTRSNVAALQPFRVPRERQTRTSPYGDKPKNGEKNGDGFNAME